MTFRHMQEMNGSGFTPVLTKALEAESNIPFTTRVNNIPVKPMMQRKLAAGNKRIKLLILQKVTANKIAWISKDCSRRSRTPSGNENPE